MTTEMVPIEIIGMKRDLPRFLEALRELGCVHIDNALDSPDLLVRPLSLDGEMLRRQEEIGLLASRVEGLLEVFRCYRCVEKAAPVSDKAGAVAAGPVAVIAVTSGVEKKSGAAQMSQVLEDLLPAVQALTRRREELADELASLPLYEATLRRLLPLVPKAAHEPGNSVVGVLVNRANVAVLDLVGKQVLELTRGAAHIVSRDVDEATRAMLMVAPKAFEGEIETLLGHKDVSRLRLPPELGNGLPDAALAIIHRRLREIPNEQRQVESELRELSRNWCDRFAAWQAGLQSELDGYQVLSRFGETDMTFVLSGWTPRNDLERVKTRLGAVVGEPLLVQEMAPNPALLDRSPIQMENPPPAQPFESLVRMLEMPRYKHIDPTRLMAFFLPVFFGLMLGDIGYGILILGISLVLRRRYRAGFLHDLITVIAIGSGWAILFGVLFGEVFGTLGESLGLHPIWMARDSAEDVIGLLLLTVAIGAGHVTLGLVLGVWEALRDRSRTHLLERGGMLVGLIGLFLLVGVLVGFLPDGLMTPAVAGVIIGIVLLSASLGWIGILMGPIEFIGLIGNVLSYLRIAAIGLASVYLAKVANEMAGMVGSVLVGLIVAVLIHALNLVLGVFSPTIHSLRLHYIEFFRKFYEGGGRPYEPFRNRTA